MLLDAGKLNKEGPSCVGHITSRPPGFSRVFDAREIFCTLVWRNVTARGSPKGGKYNSFDMNGGILVGGFINCICTFYEEERKTFKTPGENPRGFTIR